MRSGGQNRVHRVNRTVDSPVQPGGRPGTGANSRKLEADENKASEVIKMETLVRFAPWIAFGLVGGHSGWTAGVVAGLAATVAVAIYSRRGGAGVDILTGGSVVFFAAMLALSPVLSHTTQHYYTQALSHGFMALLMWLSILVGRPFTLPFAKREAPQHVWNTRRFRRTNLVISALWAASFTLGTIILLGIAAHHTTDGTTLVQVASIVAPMSLGKRYIEYSRRELTNA
jgi:hypothetical protein